RYPQPFRSVTAAVRPLTSFGPAFGSDERHEHATFMDRFGEAVSVARDDRQPLLVRGADGKHEATAVRELVFQRLRHARRRGGNEDAVVWRVVHVPDAPVADDDSNVAIAKRVEARARRIRELRPPLDRDDVARELR